MVTVTAFIKHGYISKPLQAEPYTAVAHARYITRANETSHVYSEHIPRQYHARERFLKQHEDGLRKNGRVCDKFIISIPHDVSKEQAVKALREFGWRLGHGRTPFMFSLQGFEGKNHHAHFVFIDRDVETGKRVFGTTLRDSTAMIKLEWEQAANGTFERLGLDVRVKVHEGIDEHLEADNDNALVADAAPDPDPYAPIEEIEPPADTEELSVDGTEAEDAGDGDDEVAKPYIAHPTLKPDEMTPEERVRFALDMATEGREILRRMDQRDEALRRYEVAKERAMKKVLEASDAGISTSSVEMDLHAARAVYDHLHKSNGKAKGFKLALFGRTLWQSDTARRAAESEARMERAMFRYDAALRDLEMLQQDSQRLSTEANELYQRAQELANRLNVEGTDEELTVAAEMHAESVRVHLEGMTVEEMLVMVEEGEITDDQFRELMRVTGRMEELARFEEQEGQSL